MSCTWLNPIAAPLALLLMALYSLFQGAPENESKYAYALALIFVAIIVRLLLLPFQMKSKRGMLKQTRLQPKLAELQKKHGANKQKLNEEMAKLYKDEGVNPASGCLWSFIQMPIMIALFYAIRQPFTLMMRIRDELWETVGETYNETGLIFQKFTELGIELPEPGNFYAELFIAQDVSTHWEQFKNLGIEGLQRISFYLGNVNLAQIPQWNYFWNPEANGGWEGTAWVPGLLLFLLPIISGGAQFFSAHILRKTTPQPTPDANQGSAGTIMKLMPLMSVWFGFILPAALSVYWTIGTGLQIAQDLWLNKRYTRILDEEDAEKEEARKAKEAELEAKRLETERLKAEGLLTENRNTSKRKKQKLERQGQREKAAEWEKRNAPDDEKDTADEPSRVGNRRYARGRAYDPDRYSNNNANSADNEDDESENKSPDDDIRSDDDYIGYDEDESDSIDQDDDTDDTDSTDDDDDDDDDNM